MDWLIYTTVVLYIAQIKFKCVLSRLVIKCKADLLLELHKFPHIFFFLTVNYIYSDVVAQNH